MESLIQENKIKATKKFLKKSKPSNSDLILAIRCERREIAELLIKDKRIDPSFSDNWVICEVVKRGFINLLKLLLKDKRIDPNVNYNEPLCIAAKEGHYEITKLLLDFLQGDGDDALFNAARQGHEKIVELLLDDERINTEGALSIALESGHKRIVRLLLSSSRISHSERNSAICYAASHGFLEFFDFSFKSQELILTLLFRKPSRMDMSK